MREYFSKLTATFSQPVFKRSAQDGGFSIISPRGSPENVGDDFEISHPVVRTNPVTGWRSIFAVGLHCKEIDDVTPYENRLIKEYIEYLITQCVTSALSRLSLKLSRHLAIMTCKSGSDGTLTMWPSGISK